MDQLTDSRCDKCGEFVDPKNDAVMLDVLLLARVALPPAGALFRLMTSAPRHLLPTDKCPGSPSRAQYLEGQPRDQRPEYPYNEQFVQPIRSVYAEMQRTKGIKNGN